MTAAPAPRKRAPRKPPTATPAGGAAAAEAASSATGPVDIDSSDQSAVPMVDLFKLDGVMYRVPAEPPAGLVFGWQKSTLDAQAKKGRAAQRAAQNHANVQYLTAFIGEDAYAALTSSPKVSQEHIADIFAKAGDLAFGAVDKLEATQGN